MNITEERTHNGFEEVLYCEDRESGLKAFIAVHSTVLGPAVGGCRMFPYPSVDQARRDVLRLARSMTYKNAAAGLDLGGGKAVIIADPKTQKTPELMRAFGRFVDHLEGRYYTAEDVGIGVRDIERAAEETPYALGLSTGAFASGDPSPHTALGVFLSMKEALARRPGAPDLAGASVAVQGLGNVGKHLAQRLKEAGARLVVADVNPDSVADAESRLGAEPVAPDSIHLSEVDVYAPCAMGGALTPEVIAGLKASVVCGAANNQLAEARCGALLQARDILYVPDYLANSGGMISIASEIFRVTDDQWVTKKIETLAQFAGRVIDRAIAADRPPHEIADEMVGKRLADPGSGSYVDCP